VSDESVSRRSFLRGGAAIGLTGIAAAACSSSKKSTSAASTSAAPSAAATTSAPAPAATSAAASASASAPASAVASAVAGAPADGSTVKLNLVCEQTVFAWWHDVVALFNQDSKYKIDATYTSISNANAKVQVPTTLSGRDAPDMCYILAGPHYAGQVTRANLVEDLTPYAAQYKWQDRYGAAEWKTFYNGGILPTVAYDAVPHPVIWYKPDQFAKLGITIPANRQITKAQMDDIVKKSRAAGLQPVALGNKDMWPGSQTMSITVQRVLDADTLEKLGGAWIADTGVKWTDAGPTKAVEMTQQLFKDGWFIDARNALAYTDAQTAFVSGKATMMQDGFWGSTAWPKVAPGVNIDWFHFPILDPAIPLRIINFGANGMVISKKSKNKAAAAALLDVAISPKAQTIFFEKYGSYPGILGIDRVAGITYPNDNLKTIVAMVDSTENDPFQMENDSPADIGQQVQVQTQSLLGLSITPAKFASQLQAEIDTSIKNQKD
jgi:raffinose/stachyose/melibiose transport system substrate-binding protein